MGDRPIWIKMSGLSMPLWNEDIFLWICDNLRKFLDYDKSMLETGTMTCAHVLVSLDTREFLVENIIL